MTEKTYSYEIFEDFKDEEEMEIFLLEAFKSNNPEIIAKSVGIIARAKGMRGISDQTGLAREQLYKSFSQNGNPTLKTLLAVMQSLEIDLQPKFRTHSTNEI